jgi:hypothetical protein
MLVMCVGHWWTEADRGKLKYSSATLSTTNSTWTVVELNLCHCGNRLVTDPWHKLVK